MNITLLAKSSSEGLYNVDFKEVNGLLTVWCNCRAGKFGNLCKHKRQLLNGDEKMLVDQSQAIELEAVNKLAIERNLGNLYKEVDAQELAKKEFIKKQKKIKGKVKKVLLENVVLSKAEFMDENDEFFQIDKEIAYINYKISKEKITVGQRLKNGF